MELCPDCYLPIWKPELEAASSPVTPWCECPLLKIEERPVEEDE